MPNKTFADALDRLISEFKDDGMDIEEMIADLEGAAAGLQAELDDA